MNKDNKVILVTGATGRQGGASVRHLLARGWRVRALVLDPNEPAANSLAASGVEIVQGDLNDRASVDRAMHGAYGVHSIQAYMPKDPAGEIRRGINVAEVLSRVVGRPIRFVELSMEQARAFDANLARFCVWLKQEGFHADIPALRTMVTELMTLETWLRKNGWEHATA